MSIHPPWVASNTTREIRASFYIEWISEDVMHITLVKAPFDTGLGMAQPLTKPLGLIECRLFFRLKALPRKPTAVVVYIEVVINDFRNNADVSRMDAQPIKA
jgi:hypothetical protein